MLTEDRQDNLTTPLMETPVAHPPALPRRRRRGKANQLAIERQKQSDSITPVTFTKDDPRIQKAPFRYHVAPHTAQLTQQPLKPYKPLSVRLFDKTLKGVLWGVKIGSAVSVLTALATWVFPPIAPITGIIAMLSPVVCGVLGGAIGLITAGINHLRGHDPVPTLQRQSLKRAFEPPEDCQFAEELVTLHSHTATQQKGYSEMDQWHRKGITPHVPLQGSINAATDDMQRTIDEPAATATTPRATPDCTAR